MTTYKLKHDRVTWTNIIHPTPDDIEALRRDYPYIHPLNLEDILSPMERPKLDEDENYLFLVLHFPQWDAVQRLSRAREVDILLGRGYVVTIHDGSLKPLNRLFQQCESDETARFRFLGRGANHTFYTIIDQLVDYIFPMLRKVDQNIHNLEESIFTAETRKVIREITLIRRDVIALRRIIRQQVPVIEQLEHTEHPIIHEDLEEYFSDLVDHMSKARDFIDEDFEIVGNLAETTDTLANYRINEAMRILTVFSVILLPLTLISSVYGMNVLLPFQQDERAFLLICIGMLLISMVLLFVFRRRGWL
ncbi:MAG: magnesium/cobalt transporter CorA [Phototrophicaceae bacterium]|jgi:magnesium transporter